MVRLKFVSSFPVFVDSDPGLWMLFSIIVRQTVGLDRIGSVRIRSLAIAPRKARQSTRSEYRAVLTLGAPGPLIVCRKT
jgi:hypothetical protein